MRAPEEARADARLAINGGDPVVCPTQSIEVEVDLSWAAEQARCLVGEQRAFAWYGGPLQREFEERFAKFAGSQLAVMCSSGTAALLLTCTALGIQPGSTVVLPTFTWHSCLATILQLGCRPCFTGINPRSLVMEPDQIPDGVPPSSVWLVSHTLGRAVDVEEIAKRFPFQTIIEDAAEAQATRFRGTQVGGWGRATCWSLTTAHNEIHSAAVSGVVTTNDPDLAAQIRVLAHYGKQARQVIPDVGLNPRPVTPGFNCMTNEVEAAVALATVKIAQHSWARRKQVGTRLEAGFRSLGFDVPDVPAGCENNYYDAIFLLDPDWVEHRDWLVAALNAEGCPAWSYYSQIDHPWLEPWMTARGWWTPREQELKESDGPLIRRLVAVKPKIQPAMVDPILAAVEKVTA